MSNPDDEPFLVGKPATAADRRKTHPISMPQTAAWDLPIDSLADLRRILHGLIPLDMDDRWFVYADKPYAAGSGFSPAPSLSSSPEDNTVKLHMFRSWTGFEIFRITIDILPQEEASPSNGPVAQCTSIVWETDPNRYTAEHPEDAAKEMVARLIQMLLYVPTP